MPKISNQIEYPELTQAEISVLDFLIGTKDSNGVTRTFAIGDIVAAVVSSSYKFVTLSNASDYQDDDFIGATNVIGWFAGSEILTSGIIDGFNSTTGTVTFKAAYAPLSGEIILLSIGSSTGSTIKNANIIEATLTSDTTFQSNAVINSNSRLAWVNGMELDGAGILSSYDNSTGTFTFNGAQTGKIKILYT